ncbi:MMPL family transporter [Streptomyces parvus]|uniref:MMPL family transporter n=1 Tax=Streptomyces parvus TaxID=66428 RepID=A0A5D4JIF3_9ACTN|nr:MMPL family transporter [Streptomyces parvus]
MGGQSSAAGCGSGLRTAPRAERRSPAPGPAGRCALRGRARVERHFPAGTASPLTIVAPAAGASGVRNQVAATPGVASSVIVPSGAEGRVLVLATLSDTPDSARARETVTRLRASLAGTGVLVGGQSAQHADLQEASVRGQLLITPLVLLVVLVLLVLLLRCVPAAVASGRGGLGQSVHRLRGSGACLSSGYRRQRDRARGDAVLLRLSCRARSGLKHLPRPPDPQ